MPIRRDPNRRRLDPEGFKAWPASVGRWPATGFDPARYAVGNGIERGFGQLQQWRGLATRYDKHARHYAGATTWPRY
jgi:transposase